jgi:DNA-binding response OmpR family regulator
VGKHLGTGVGLALLKSLVELHRGYILVSSERFKGTEFILGFPLGSTHLNPEEKIMGAPDQVQFRENDNSSGEISFQDASDEIIQHKILPSLLIVEDNEELRKMLAEHFSLRYEVFEAEDGGKGYDSALNHLPDIIISDVMMPVKDGFELCRSLKENIRTSHIPVVLLTAKSSVESQIEGTEAGADEYIAKPFSLKLLDAKIDRMLENYRKIKEKFGNDVLSSSREIARNQKDREFMESLTGFLDKNLDNSDLSVDEICLEVGLGRTNLYKKMKSLTDQSLGEFIRTYRLKKAAAILMAEDISVSEVIYRVGINSHSYFTKAFKMQFKYTPSEFVRRLQIPSGKKGSNPF